MKYMIAVVAGALTLGVGSAEGATVPPPVDEATEAAVLEAFVAMVDGWVTTSQDVPQAATDAYLAPVCVFWVATTDAPDVDIWRCYATLGTPEDVGDVVTSTVHHDTATGEITVFQTLVYTDPQMRSADSRPRRPIAPRAGRRCASARTAPATASRSMCRQRSGAPPRPR